MRRLLAIDPGIEKCGFALLTEKAELLDHGIIQTGNLEIEFEKHFRGWARDQIILGNGTFSKRIQQTLAKRIGSVPLQLVDEHDSTYRARKLYFKYNPPKGVWRFIPLGLQVPPVPYDDFAAMLLGIRYLECEANAHST